MGRQRAAYTSAQLANAMGWTMLQFVDACGLLLLPEPDVSRPQRLGWRWSPAVVRGLVERRDALTADLGMGALGAYRLAEEMAERLGVDVDADAIVELSRLGHIPRAGEYRGRELYAVWAATRFTDRPALEQAMVSGRLRTTDGAARVLDVRRADVDHLVRLRWLRPARMADNPVQSRSRGQATVPLFRHGDLAALLAYEGIDWTAVRATPRGRPSPLARLGKRDAAAGAELERLSRGLLYHRLGHRHWAAGDTAAAVDCWRAAGNYAEAELHLESAADGDPAPIVRCAAWMALLPPARAELA